MEKNCNCPDVRATSSGHCPNSGSYVQQSCNRLDAKATLSRRGLNMESVEGVMERRLYSCPSGRPQVASKCGLEKSDSESNKVFYSL